MNDRIAKLEVKRSRLHEYLLMKIEERDYHAVADAAMDLRELEVAVNMLKDEYRRNQDMKVEASLHD